MGKNISLTLFSLLYYVRLVSCVFLNVTSLAAIVFLDQPDVPATVHSDYYFGKCATVHKSLFATVNLNYEDIKNKVVYRGHLNYRHINSHNETEITIPDCVHIQGSSMLADQYKFHPFYFNICICRLVVNYAGHKYVYVFFEWYIPVFIQSNIKWKLQFYCAYRNLDFPPITDITTEPPK